MLLTVLRSIFTVAMFAIFIGIVWWAYGPSRRQRFERDADLPFADEALHLRSQKKESSP